MKRSTLKRLTTSTALVMIGVAVWYVSGADYEDALDAEREYCALVFKGTYPDYKHIYAEVCHVDGTVRAH